MIEPRGDEMVKPRFEIVSPPPFGQATQAIIDPSSSIPMTIRAMGVLRT
ncbi:MAG: hypothetical protein MI724_15835 [Spirochaetales bacterium]|nr:hypothetical protein [Spirochaetales bacterium]